MTIATVLSLAAAPTFLCMAGATGLLGGDPATMICSGAGPSHLTGMAFIGLGISIYPYVVPRAVTIWDAAVPYSSQLFLLVGAVFILPLILAYTAWAYWVFRGKVGEEGYH